MKFTRKCFIKHAGLAGMSLLIPLPVSLIYRYFKNESVYDVTHINNIRSFKRGLEKYFKRAVYHGTEPDVLILNSNTMNEYDFVFLKYTREVSDAPIVVSLKDEAVMPLDEEDLREQVRLLKDISLRYDVFIYCETDIKEWFSEIHDSASAEQYFPEFIQRIRECGIYNEISEELYRPVSVVYMKKYMHDHDKNRWIVDLKRAEA